MSAQDELYLYVGRMIALSILQGGPGPVFFAPVIVDYIFGGISAVKPSVDDVPDEELQLKIRKVHCAVVQKRPSCNCFLDACTLVVSV